MEELALCTGFDWDEWNAAKIWAKHEVSQAECEQVFFNEPLVVAEDLEHSKEEPRYFALGVTAKGRGLFVVSTIRGRLVRVITARDMSRRERRDFRDVQAKGDTQVSE